MSPMFVPGPLDVAPEVLQQQTKAMLPHRSKDFQAIFQRAGDKLRQVFYTQYRVFIMTNSGSGAQEAAVRNLANESVLSCVNGAFSKRWYDVAVALSDLGNDVEWRREWVAAERTSEGPPGVGARYRLTAELLGRPAATVYEAIAHEPNRLAAWKAVSGPLPLTFSRAFDGVEGGTRVTMRYEMEMRPLLRLAAPLLARMGRRQLEGDYPKLTQLLETAS